jgi:hypothetical protein
MLAGHGPPNSDASPAGAGAGPVAPAADVAVVAAPLDAAVLAVVPPPLGSYSSWGAGDGACGVAVEATGAVAPDDD